MMHTRNHNKPPLTTRYNVSQSLSNKSENLDESQLNRRQMIGGRNMVGKANSGALSPPLSKVNTISGDNGGVPDTANSNGDCDGVGVVFNSREDVAKLLSEKSKLRSKADVQATRLPNLYVTITIWKDEWYEKLHQEAKVLHYLVAIKAQEKEAEARAASENLRYGLMEDLEKATQEINNLNS
ncbi:hypothetical protein HPP92_026378 [Vanilla planifolia]|uniref:Uncharacterized protein n=1 Tax=Vanilla planifolia TaxID=51239 RepID=A0A835PFH6_VANPL|nr:hypothetical protein HPP92_026378 [Vanilla planifolia]